MKRSTKESFVADMKGRLERAQAVFLVDYQGLDVGEISDLRNELRKIDVEFKVVKNRLMKLASRGTDSALLEDHFVGPCAVAITYGDAISPAKVLVAQSKALDKMELKAGQVGGKFIDFESIKRLSELPSREGLLSMLLSAMQGVPGSFVRTLNAVPVGLLNVLKAIETQKGEEQGN